MLGYWNGSKNTESFKTLWGLFFGSVMVEGGVLGGGGGANQHNGILIESLVCTGVAGRRASASKQLPPIVFNKPKMNSWKTYYSWNLCKTVVREKFVYNLCKLVVQILHAKWTFVVTLFNRVDYIISYC